MSIKKYIMIKMLFYQNKIYKIMIIDFKFSNSCNNEV